MSNWKPIEELAMTDWKPIGELTEEYAIKKKRLLTTNNFCSYNFVDVTDTKNSTRENIHVFSRDLDADFTFNEIYKRVNYFTYITPPTEGNINEWKPISKLTREYLLENTLRNYIVHFKSRLIMVADANFDDCWDDIRIGCSYPINDMDYEELHENCTHYILLTPPEE